MEKDAKKAKKKSPKEAAAAAAAPPWPWQGLVENLHLANQELSVIIDLINTVGIGSGCSNSGYNSRTLPGTKLSEA